VRSLTPTGTLAARASLVLFVAAVLAEHLIRPGLSPWRHQISEYANGSAGGLMTVGFFAWAVSLALTSGLLAAHARLLSLSIAVGAAGMLLIALFHTQTVAGQLPSGTARTTGGRLHDLGGELLAGGLLVSAALVAVSDHRLRRLRRLALLTVGYFVVVTAGLLLVADSAGGLRQRLVLLAALVWQASLLSASRDQARAGHPVRGPVK
jgi:hypothetical protein